MGKHWPVPSLILCDRPPHGAAWRLRSPQPDRQNRLNRLPTTLSAPPPPSATPGCVLSVSSHDDGVC